MSCFYLDKKLSKGFLKQKMLLIGERKTFFAPSSLEQLMRGRETGLHLFAPQAF
jgi:hypothetical protein